MDYTRIFIFFAIGLFVFLRPDLVWKFEKTVFFKQGKQTDSHKKITMIGGVVLVIAAVVMACKAFL